MLLIAGMRAPQSKQRLDAFRPGRRPSDGPFANPHTRGAPSLYPQDGSSDQDAGGGRSGGGGVFARLTGGILSGAGSSGLSRYPTSSRDLDRERSGSLRDAGDDTGSDRQRRGGGERVRDDGFSRMGAGGGRAGGAFPRAPFMGRFGDHDDRCGPAPRDLPPPESHGPPAAFSARPAYDRGIPLGGEQPVAAAQVLYSLGRMCMKKCIVRLVWAS
jgi:hypothetical protein